MADNGEIGTCLEGVQEVDLRDKFAAALFSKLEECETEKDLKKKIIEILDDNNIDFEANTSFIEYKSKLTQYVTCAVNEIAPDPAEPDKTIQLSQIVTGIVSFLCNPPKFEFKKLKFELKLSLFLKALLNAIIDSLIQLLANLISGLISLSFELCENNKLIDFDLQANINNLLDFSALERIFGKYDIVTQGNQALIQNLDNCEPLFQLSQEDKDIANTQRPFRDNGDGTRSRTSKGTSPTNFISDLDLVINPLELCSLLEGAPSDTTLDAVKELLRYEYPNLYSKFDDNTKIIDLFKDIGNTLDPSVCDSLRQLRTTYTVDDLCSQDFLKDLENKKAIALRNKGFSDDITKALLDKEKKKIADKHAQAVATIGKLRDNPARLLEDVETNVFCKNGKPGIMKLTDIPKMDTVAEIAIESIFSTYKIAHKMDFDGFAESKFVSLKPTKKIVPRYEKNVPYKFDNNGNPSGSLKTAETNDYKIAKEGQGSLLLTQKKGYALKDADGNNVAAARLKVSLKKGSKTINLKNHKGDEDNYSLQQLYIADLEEFDSPKDFKKYIIGAVKETKKKVLRSKHARQPPRFFSDNTSVPLPVSSSEGDSDIDDSGGYDVFSVNTGSDSPYAKYSVGSSNKATGRQNYYISLYDGRAKYYPSYFSSNGIGSSPVSLSDMSLLDLPEIIQKSDASLEVDDQKLNAIKSLTGVAITKEQLEAPLLIYQKSNFTEKPYYKTTNGIKNLVSENFPNGYSPKDTSISSENDVFNQFYKSKTGLNASADLYINCYANLMARQSFLFDLMAIEDENKDDDILNKYIHFSGTTSTFSYNKFSNFITSMPYENIADYPNFQKQVLEEFLNDPCAIKDDDELTDPSPLAGAIKIPTVRLLIRNHIMKFSNMFINTLYAYDFERMYENSDLYVQFLVQTFKQDLTKLSLTGGRLSLGFYDQYFQFLNEYFDSQISANNGLFEPITGQKVDLNQDFSDDYKLGHFIKVELQYLKDRYNTAFRSVKNEDLFLIQMLERQFIPEKYVQQMFITFEVIATNNNIDVIYANSNLSQISSWYYGVVVWVRNGNNINPIAIFKESTKQSRTITKSSIPSFANVDKIRVFKQFRKDKEFKLLFDYVFCLSKIISTIHIENCLETIEYDQFASNMLIASDEAIRDSATRASNKRVNRNGVLEDPAEQSDCWNPTSTLDNPNSFDFGDINFSGMLKKLILKLILQTPIVILKSLVEMTDPNIAIASKLRTAAATATCTPLPVLPFSLSLLPFTLIPSPFSVGPPVIPPLGHIYLGVDMVEYLAEKKNKRKCATENQKELGDINTVQSATLCKKGCSEAKYENFKKGIDVRVGTDDCPD